MPPYPVDLAGENIQLLPQRALYWPRRQTLVFADPHFGKAASFRAAAVPVPVGTTAEALARLDSALAQTGARRLICLGDLLHARSGRASQTLATVTTWRSHRPDLEITLVRGNHDRQAGDPPAEWCITCLDEPVMDPPFIWRHQPADELDGYAVAGHLHPAARLAGPGGQRQTLPCFYFGPRCGILPAFGDFTGTALVGPKRGDRLYVLAGDEIVAYSFG